MDGERARQHNPASREQVAAILRQRFERFGLGAGDQGGVGGPVLLPRRGLIGPPPPPHLPPGPLPPPLAVPRPPAQLLGAGVPLHFRGGPGAVGPAGPLPAAPPPLLPLAPARALAMAHLPRNPPGRPPPFFRQVSVSSSSPPDDDDSLDGGAAARPRTANVAVEGDVICYSAAGDDAAGGQQLPGAVGLFIGGRPLSGTRLFFEVEILDKANAVDPPGITIGLCSKQHPMDLLPGWHPDSVGLLVGEGILFRGRPHGQLFGPSCDVGDKVGCGIRVVPGAADGKQAVASVFFTRNGKEFVHGPAASVVLSIPAGGLFPSVALTRPGEEVSLRQGVGWSPEEDMMVVDGGEDEWIRLHDIRLNGQLLEYVGRGKSLVDVGLAQARTPICTRNHYFEIEIVDPGASCYIAIGLARRDYPKNRHPGWNKGSIAYHADDGKVFVGSGVGAPFGPRCHKGDVMGCGILFPRNYECKSDSEEELEQQGGGGLGVGVGVGGVVADVGGGAAGAVVDVAAGDHDYIQVDEFGSDSAEDDDEDDDEWWHDRMLVQSGVRVQIYFTRNGKVIGKKDVRIPKGGFYPTIGMMSCQEKVRVDLRPLSG